MPEPIDIRSFKELQDSEKIAHIMNISDDLSKRAREGAEALKAMTTEVTPETPISMRREAVEEVQKIKGRKKAGRKPKGQEKTWVPFYTTAPMKRLINNMATSWNVSKSSILRFAIVGMAKEYEFEFDESEILLDRDINTKERGKDVKRPFVTKPEYEKEEARRKGRTYGGKRDERPRSDNNGNGVFAVPKPLPKESQGCGYPPFEPSDDDSDRPDGGPDLTLE